MDGRHVISVVVDGLRASALGAYGNTSVPTPELDAVASRAVVADWLWADSPSLAGFYRSAWQGVHALQPVDQPSVPELLQKAGVLQWLVTDDAWLTEQSMHLPFDEALLVETHADKSAALIEETAIAQLFSNALEQLEDWREDVSKNAAGSMLWLHARGLYGPWDAPLAMRSELLDEEDPPAAEYVEPSSEIRDINDPDEMLKHRVAYAAQVGVVDACVGAFLQAIEESFDDSETLVMVLGSRGFALGEHGAVGTNCEELFSERLHLPWFAYECGKHTPLPRHSGIVQPMDVGATVLNWLNVYPPAEDRDGVSLTPQLRGELPEGRELAISSGGKGEIVARTDEWMLRIPPGDGLPHLYSKPDDRWEFNDVASRCPDEVEKLLGALEEVRR